MKISSRRLFTCETSVKNNILKSSNVHFQWQTEIEEVLENENGVEFSR